MALSTQRALPSLLSPESVSFRDKDRYCRNFIFHLCDKLQHSEEIKIFTDEDLEIGAPIPTALLSAIEQLLVAVAALSPYFATSTWCLDELAKIVETMKARKNAILPVFLDVDPSDVGHQGRSFAEAFTKHEEGFSHDKVKVERWIAALTAVADLSESDSKNFKYASALSELSGLIQVIVSSLAKALVRREELFPHDIDKAERWAVANISGFDTNYDGMEKGITEVLEKVLRVDGLGLIHENKLKEFRELDRHIYIRCLAKILFCVDLGNGIRELAGLLIRNELRNTYDPNDVVEQFLRNWIKQKLLAIICSPGDSVPRSTFQVISELARNMLKCWPELNTLIERSLHDEQLLTPAVLETFGYVSETIGPNGEGTVRKILKVLVRGMNLKSNDSVCLAATKAMYYALSFAEINFFDDMEVILKAVLENVGSSDQDIEQAAYECLIVLPSRFYCNLCSSPGLFPTYLRNIKEITTKAVRECSIQAIQFWSSICEAEIDILKKINSSDNYQCYYLIRDNLMDLILLLLPLFHREKIELLDSDDKAREFNISLCLCVGYIAQAVGRHVESFTEAVELVIDVNRTTGYNYLAEVIAIIVCFFVSDIFGNEVSEVNKRVDLTGGGKKGKAANEMERGEGSQKPEKPDKEKGLGQWEEHLLRQMLRIVGRLLKQNCQFLRKIFEDVFFYLRERHGDDLLMKFCNSWVSTRIMIQFISVFFSVSGCHSGGMIENLQMNLLQIDEHLWIQLLIFPDITNCEKLLKRGGDYDEIREQLDIDHFAQCYIKTLGSRIHCVDWKHEKRRLQILRNILSCGKQEYDKSLYNMWSLAHNSSLDAQEILVNNSVGGTVMNLATVGPYWPFDLSFENLILPEELAKMAEDVGEFMKKSFRRRVSRKLVKMIHPLSSCTTLCRFGTETMELVMSTMQTALLIHFETADTWTFSDLLTKLGITHDELISLIHSLSQENSKLLIKEPNTENILPTDRFELNTNFTFTSPIPLPVPEDNRRKNVVES